MALLTKEQFAKKISRPSNFLSVYISRGEVVIHSGEKKNALIDDEHPVNAMFLNKKAVKELVKESKTPENTGNSEQKTEVYEAVVIGGDGKKRTPSNGKDANEVYLKNLAALEQEKAELSRDKQREELEKIRLFNEKARGESLPIALFKPLLSRNNQNITITFKNLTEELISNMAKKKAFTLEERAEVQQFLLEGINKAVTDANDMTVQNLEVIIDDYKESIK